MLSNDERVFLADISRKLCEGAVVLEVGTSFGGSSAIMAISNPHVVVNTIDLFYDIDYKEIKSKLSIFENINVYKGNSFEDFKSWNKMIDLYFEDGAHENPALEYSLNQWLPLVNIDGLVLIHDNNYYFPDVQSNIHKMILSGSYKNLYQIDSMSVLKKVR